MYGLHYSPVNVGVPGEGAGDVNSKIFCTCDRLQNSPVKYVVSFNGLFRKVQVDKDQENAPSEKDSHSKKEMAKNQTKNQVLIP